MSDNQLLEQIERYLNGEMTKDERARFEILRNEDTNLNKKVAEHRHFVNLIKQYGERLELEKRLNALHSEIDVHSLEEELIIHPSWIVSMWRNHHSKISVAASIAIFAVLCTLFFTGYLNNKELNYAQLKGDIANTKKSINALQSKVNGLNHAGKGSVNPGNFRGTGFAISSNGYIVTDYHVVKDADSVYVQSFDGKSYRTKVIYSEPGDDIAVLQITDPSFKTFGAIPYAFKKADTDIGENVFTIGYPRDVIVLGPGFLTASTGFRGDTTQYQVSTPVDFGNSGGPLLDSKGNVIGIINAKETHVEGAAFAVKSSYLLKTIQDIPDSLKSDLNINSKNVLAGLNRVQQIKKMQNYVFMVKVYNQ
ncbi:trypsin-like peptidase [Mucilaginibacter frigoritolerans]|uniref:Trypsin-like peptidase n=1 Tax=Mucilaginibacter frigoritolerans TaxID=652788 RepID=A0A562TRT8_9SPHI|nr:serine protease [Mucilaginibacter frigoritolerans]TWI96321.1 trypsin-like peptidase [Mucilaginibacter frigoritolerans]